MSEKARELNRVLAVYPFHRGFAFAVLENPLRWIDSGTRRVSKGDDIRFANLVEALIKRHLVNRVAVENDNVPVRGFAAMHRVARVIAVAQLIDVRVVMIGARDVRKALGAPQTAKNHDVSVLLAEAFPELGATRPKKRRPWESDSERTKTLRAVGLAVAGLVA
jgi:hypothetical protein